MKGNDGTRRSGGLAEGDVGDDAATAEDGDAALATAGEDGDSFHDIGPGGDLENVGAKSVGAVAGDNDGWFWLIFGPSWTTAGAAAVSSGTSRSGISTSRIRASGLVLGAGRIVVVCVASAAVSGARVGVEEVMVVFGEGVTKMEGRDRGGSGGGGGGDRPVHSSQPRAPSPPSVRQL